MRTKAHCCRVDPLNPGVKEVNSHSRDTCSIKPTHASEKLALAANLSCAG